MRTPTNMADCSKKRCYRKDFPVNRISLIITMVLVCASATEWDAARMTDCWQWVTCTQCAARPSCSWSLRRQACAGSSETSGKLRVHEPAACPSFTAVSRFVAAGDATYAYALRVRNAPPGFAEFLGRSGIRCDVAGVKLEGRLSGDRIECASTSAAALWRRRVDRGAGDKAKGGGADEEDEDDDDDDYDDDGYVIVRHARVTIADGRVTLRPDNVSDGYFAASRRPDCVRDAWDAACVTCARHDTAGTEYFVRCSGRNRCTGLFEYRDAWPPRPRRRRRPDSRADDADGPLSCERDVRVRSVEPATAPWTGGAKLTVTVGDQGILAEKAAVSVTVAGRACADPHAVLDTSAVAFSVITCVLPAAAAADGPDGGAAAAVRVRYQLNRTLELLYAGPPFRYAYPEIAAVERTVRWANGSAVTEWTVRGALLDAGRGVRVLVGADDAECARPARPSPDRITCSVPAERARDSDDRLAVEFDGGLRVRAVLRPQWAVYVGEPTVDAGQSFRALASGGTALPVRGRRLLYAARVRFYAGATAAGHGACRVLNDTYAACVAPALDSDAAVDDVGLLMDFAGRRDFRAPAAAASYRAYPDPVFKDFEADPESGTITVHGGGGGGGGVAYAADDVTVRLYADAVGAAEQRCDVVAVRADCIVCASSLPPAVLERARSVVVAVGDRFRVHVAAARKPDGRGGPAAASGFAHAHRWIVLTVAVSAVLSGAAAQVCLMRRRARRREERKAAAAAATERKPSYCSVRLTGSQCSSVDLAI